MLRDGVATIGRAGAATTGPGPGGGATDDALADSEPWLAVGRGALPPLVAT